MKRLKLLAHGLMLVVVSVLAAGCAQVMPWEKGTLAKPDMTFADDVLETRFAEHIYSSKEASTGGAGVGGGGCGCN